MHMFVYVLLLQFWLFVVLPLLQSMSTLAASEFQDFALGPEVLGFFTEVLHEMNIFMPSKPDPHFHISAQGKSNESLYILRSGF